MAISGAHLHFLEAVTYVGITQLIQADGGGGVLSFAGNVALQALDSASLTANSGETVNVGGNARVSADDFRSFGTADGTLGLDAQGGLWITTSNRDGLGIPAADDDKVLRIQPPTSEGSSPL